MSRYATARFIGISESYLRDIEKSRRAPFRRELIERTALYLETDVTSLLEAAAVDRGAVSIATTPSNAGIATRVAAALERPETLKALERVMPLIEKAVGGLET